MAEDKKAKTPAREAASRSSSAMRSAASPGIRASSASEGEGVIRQTVVPISDSSKETSRGIQPQSGQHGSPQQESQARKAEPDSQQRAAGRRMEEPSTRTVMESPMHHAMESSARSADRRPSHDEIALLAVQYWQEQGRTHGHDLADWFRAEQDLLRRAEQDHRTRAA